MHIIFKRFNIYDNIPDDPTYKTDRLDHHYDFEIGELEGDLYFYDSRYDNAYSERSDEVKIPSEFLGEVLQALTYWNANKTYTTMVNTKIQRVYPEGEIPF